MWVRGISDSARSNEDNLSLKRDDLMDIFGLVGDFRFNGWSASLYGLYALNGKDARGGDFFPVGSETGPSLSIPYISPVDAAGNPLLQELVGLGTRQRGKSTFWGAGLGAELTMFDPFRFTFDFFYGSADNDTVYTDWNMPFDAIGGAYRDYLIALNAATPGLLPGTFYSSKMDDRAGWYAALGAEYKASWGTPMLRGWYASGDDSDPLNGSERMPTVSGSFNATSLYHDGAFSIATSKKENVAGTWGVQAKLADLSWIDKLSHELSVSYVKGTNHKDNAIYYGYSGPMGYLTKEDSFIEIDFNTTYQIYQNLATVLELSYIIEDFDRNVWGQAYGLSFPGAAANPALRSVVGYEGTKFSDMWRAAINFRYTF